MAKPDDGRDDELERVDRMDDDVEHEKDPAIV